MKRLIFVFAISILFNNSTYGQFKKGYIVFENGDTLRGLIKNEAPEINSKRLCYKDSSGVKKTYYSDEIKYFKRENESFIKVTIDTINNSPVKRLLMIVSDGKIKLLSKEYSSPNGGIGNFGIGFMPDKDYYIMTTVDSITKIVHKNYQVILDKYFSDKKIQGKKYKLENIERDIAELNTK